MSKDDNGHQDKLHITVEPNPYRDKSFQVNQTKGMRILNRISIAIYIPYLIIISIIVIYFAVTFDWKF